MRKDIFRKGIVLGIIFLFFGAGIVPNISSKETSEDTLYVPTEYPTIRSAIISANHEDTIAVLYGTYSENLTVNKTLKIVAYNEDEESRPIINVSSYEVGINVTAPNVRIEGFIINGPSVGTDSPTIRAFSDRCIDASGLVVDGNSFRTFYADKKGELALEIYSNIKPINFSNNRFTPFNKGVSVGSHSVAFITGNSFFWVDCDVFHAAHINGLDVYYGSIQDAVTNASNYDNDNINVKNGTYYENIFINKSIKLLGKDRTNTIIDGYGNCEVIKIVAGGSGSTLENLCIRNSGVLNSGIYIRAGGITINSCDIVHNFHGIILNSFECKNIHIDNSNISNNAYSGIRLIDFCDDNTINNCDIKNNGVGIFLMDCKYNVIHSNLIENNKNIGIAVQGINSHNNDISNNDIIGNGHKNRTIKGYGILCWSSGKNNILLNNLIDNNIHAFFRSSTRQNWNGNYWEPRRLPFIGEIDFPLPYPIFGTRGLPPFDSPWVNFDGSPSMQEI